MKIFMSYSSRNRDTVKLLVDDLEAVGHEVWFDQDASGGQTWWDLIVGYVRNSDLFVIALSSEWMGSDACAREFRYAASLNKRCLPVQVAKTGDVRALPTALQSLQIVDYRVRNTDTLKALNRALNMLPPARELPDPLPVPPPAPISSMAQIADEMRIGPLTRDKQLDLLFRIKDLLSTQREPALDLLRQLRSGPELLAQIGDEIDEIIERYTGRKSFLGSAPAPGSQSKAEKPAAAAFDTSQSPPHVAQPSTNEPLVTAIQAWGPFWAGVLVWAVAGVLIGAAHLFLSRAPLTYFVGGGFAYISCLFTIPVGIIARMFFNRFPAVMNGFSALILTVLVFSSTAAFQTAFPYANSYMWPTLFIGMVTTAAFEVWRIRQAKRRLRAAG